MDGKVFDYVIVGAGSAGCVLANRLSEDPAVKVALIEAGGRDRNPWIHIPAGYYRNFSNPAVTWQFGSGPEPHLDGRTIPWPRGRVLGGSSAINGLLYVRGQAQDFDVWRQLGNVGWSYDDVLPYFKRAEDQERGADEFHGTGGPLGVSDVRLRQNADVRGLHRGLRRRRHPAQHRLQRRRAGRRRLLPAHQPQRPALLGGRRLPAARARPRRTSSIITDALVHGLELDGKRATGVRYARNGQIETVSGRARGDPGRRRHRLAADPAALRHRPRGRAEGGRRAGAPRAGGRRREPAGPSAGALRLRSCNGRGSLNDVWHSRWQQLLSRRRVRRSPRRGILTIGAGAVGAFARSRPDVDLPDIQFHFLPLSADRPGQGLHTFSGVTATVCQLRPESRGTLTSRAPIPPRTRASSPTTSPPRPTGACCSTA